MSLYQAWIDAKEAERAAVEARRLIEDQLTGQLELSENEEGSKTFERSGYTIKITQRMTRSIDGDLLQEIAEENGTSCHLPDLFRWKPDLNMRAWKSAAPSITGPLMRAITTKPGRPSYSIEPTTTESEK